MADLTQLISAVQGTTYILNVMTADMTPEQLHWSPSGLAPSVAATIAHAALTTDWQMHDLLGKGDEKPLFASSFLDKTGISDISGHPFQSLEWARSVEIDQPVFTGYAKAVYEKLVQWLGSLSDEDLARPIDMSLIGAGEQTVHWCVYNIILNHLNQLMGEISAVKGVQGLVGYPF